MSFGEQGAQLTYGSYLRLPQLLDAQHLESDPPAHDELLFITIHQVYELWFKQLLHEVAAARDAMTATGDRLWWAQHLLARVHVIERVLVQQVDVLETMTPQDFLQFRQRLAPASGFQSVQFRELEFLSGAKDPAYLERFSGLTDEEQDRLRRRLEEPTLWDAFLDVLARPRPAGRHDDEEVASVRTAAHDRSRYAAVWALAEALLQHDELAASWRARHVVMVERMIGGQVGHRRVERVGVPPRAAAAAVLPAAVGRPQPALRGDRAVGLVLLTWNPGPRRRPRLPPRRLGRVTSSGRAWPGRRCASTWGVGRHRHGIGPGVPVGAAPAGRPRPRAGGPRRGHLDGADRRARPRTPGRDHELRRAGLARGRAGRPAPRRRRASSWPCPDVGWRTRLLVRPHPAGAGPGAAVLAEWDAHVAHAAPARGARAGASTRR